jgi:hypothetical protein
MTSGGRRPGEKGFSGRRSDGPSYRAQQLGRQISGIRYAPMIGQSEDHFCLHAAATCVTTIGGPGLPTCGSLVAAAAWSSGKRQTASMQVTESEL